MARNFQAIGTDLQTAGSSPQSIISRLRRKCPEIVSQIECEREIPNLFRLWGTASNHDEIADITIVEPLIVEAICKLAGVTFDGHDVHAGVQHTWCYLFSTIETPYGFKRDRWVNSDIENGFEIRSPTLRPAAADGSLLANLTYFLGRLVFRRMPMELRMLRALRPFVSDEVKDFRYRSMPLLRLKQTVRRGRATVALHTDIVPFLKRSKARFGLLVYWVNDSREANGKLITAFPVSASVVSELMDGPDVRKVDVIRTRYNAVVDGITGELHRGTQSRHTEGARSALQAILEATG